MGTRKLRPRKNGCNLAKLPDQQWVFVNEMGADIEFNGTNAARKAGYKHPSVAACRLLGLPKIQAALGKVLKKRLERCELKADAVLNYLQMALFINPLQYFAPSDDGWWIIKDIESLPDEVGQLIEEMVLKEVEYKDGTKERVYKVRLVSHTVALGLAMKHVGLLEPRDNSVSGNGIVPNWDNLYKPRSNGQNVIEQKIIDVGKEE